MNNASQILHQQIIQNNTEITALRAEVERLRSAHTNLQHDIQQTLGRALGYPWFKNDQKNFPGSTEADGVCVGDHVAESLADEAADKIAALRAENEKLRAWETDTHRMIVGTALDEVGGTYPAIILPLTENANDKA